MKSKRTINWWGPPRKISAQREERKVSWLELFYDLVYVIAVANACHHLAEHQNWEGFLDYVYMFAMIYWGWLNGSLYHDLHGTPGVRTSLMTLWQMVIVTGLVVTLNSSGEQLVYNATIAVMIMQLYITYLWWSVGIYDKVHRVLNRPYTWIYLISFATLFITLFTGEPYTRILFFISLLLNFLPPVATMMIRWKQTQEFSLSPSMTERMGLFTIIVFGEVILGVVNGVSHLQAINLGMWIPFSLSIAIVFALWWVFFGLISDRSCKKGMLFSFLTELTYIPTLMGLGMTAVAFDGLFGYFHHHDPDQTISFPAGFNAAISLFLTGIFIMLFFLEYPPRFKQLKSKIQLLVAVAASLLLTCILFLSHWSLVTLLTVDLLILLVLILSVALSTLFISNEDEEAGSHE